MAVARSIDSYLSGLKDVFRVADPVWIEYPGAIYHVICRGNNQQAVLTVSLRGPMARLLQIEFPGAVYHVTPRYDREEAM